MREKDRTSQSTDRFVNIARAVVWPAVVLLVVVVILFVFRGQVAPRELQLDAKGLKISFFLLEAAERGGPSGTAPPKAPDTLAIQRSAQKASTVSLAGARVLWVDDNPGNNVYERNALETLGVQFSLAQSTLEARQFLANGTFQLVITDFARADDEQGGYTLLDDLKKLPGAPPLIIYSGSWTPAFEAEAKARGAYGETNEPLRLFDMAISAIKSGW
jgi:CheY-like chemotaxis protein